MNHYIFRKKLFALLFLLIVPAFSLWNFLGARQTLSEKLRVRAAQVSQGDITLGQAVSGMETAITETVRGRMNFIEGYSFITYSEHAISMGSDSQAVAYIQLRAPGGRRIFGVGTEHNINFASVKGILSAINRFENGKI